MTAKSQKPILSNNIMTKMPKLEHEVLTKVSYQVIELKQINYIYIYDLQICKCDTSHNLNSICPWKIKALKLL